MSWAVYAAPWYNSNLKCKYLIRMVLRRATKPVIVKCFGSTSFDLSNATFIVVRLILSFNMMKFKIM